MPKLLFVATDFPFPPTFGVTNKTANLIRRLREHFAITLLSFHDPGAPPAERDVREAESHCERVIVLPRRRRNATAALLRGQPVFTSRYASPEAARTVAGLTARQRFRVVHFDCVGTLPLLGSVSDPEAFTVASVNDVYTLMLLGRRRKALPGRLADDVARYLVRRFERHWYPRFDQVHFVSDVDRQFCRRLAPGADVRCVPLGVTVQAASAPDRGPEEANTLVYLANMAEAHGACILDFLHRTFPLVQERVPGARLLAVGANPPAELVERARRDPAVEVTGWVADVHPQVARGAIALSLNPLVGGMQTKVLESMALGKPVVGLPQNFTAIEGAVEGTHFLSGRSPEELADRVTALLRDRELRERIGSAARRLILERYSWESATRRYLESVLETAPDHSAVTDGAIRRRA